MRVIYELRWFRGATTEVVGTARHTPLSYASTIDTTTFGQADRCTRIAD